MSEVATMNAFGEVMEPGTLKFQRLLPGPASRLWRHLTESNLRRHWLAAGKLKTSVGAPVEFIWRNDELNDPPGQRPAGFPEEQRMKGHIIAFDPAQKLAIAWDGFGEVSYALEIKDSNVLLTMLQRGLPNRDIVVVFAAGSHTHLDILAACLTGEKPPQFWDSWSRLQKEYDTRIPR